MTSPANGTVTAAMFSACTIGEICPGATASCAGVWTSNKVDGPGDMRR